MTRLRLRLLRLRASLAERRLWRHIRRSRARLAKLDTALLKARSRLTSDIPADHIRPLPLRPLLQWPTPLRPLTPGQRLFLESIKGLPRERPAKPASPLNPKDAA